MSFVKDKVALITGGASGIGLCYARELLKNDLKAITLVDVDAVQGKEAEASLRKQFGQNRVLFVKTDVTVKKDLEAAFEKAIHTFKNLDIIINNAGIMNDAIWEKEIAINLNAVIHVCLLGIEDYLPKYKSGPEAVIVNVSSTLGLTGHGSMPIYCATKHAVVGLSKCYADPDHYERTKVRILTICPGATNTPLINSSAIRYRNLGEHYEKLLLRDLVKTPMQEPEVVAEGVLKALNEGETGSVWIIEGNVTKVNLPNHLDLIQAASETPTA